MLAKGRAAGAETFTVLRGGRARRILPRQSGRIENQGLGRPFRLASRGTIEFIYFESYSQKAIAVRLLTLAVQAVQTFDHYVGRFDEGSCGITFFQIQLA